MEPGGTVRQPYSYSVPSPIDCTEIPALASGYIGWRNRFLGTLKVKKYRQISFQINKSIPLTSPPPPSPVTEYILYMISYLFVQSGEHMFGLWSRGGVN